MKKIIITVLILSLLGCEVVRKMNELIESLPEVSTLTAALNEEFNTVCAVGYYEVNDNLNLQVYIQNPDGNLTLSQLKGKTKQLIESKSDIKYSTLSITIGDPILGDDW